MSHGESYLILSELEMEKMPSKTELILTGNPIDQKGKEIIEKFQKKNYKIIFEPV